MKKLSILFISALIAQAAMAQCYPDRHNTTWFDSWISCVPSQNPNDMRGVGHWIHYDLGYDYILQDMQVWNINDPNNLDMGAQEVVIDYSDDGENWTEFGTFFFAQGTGTSIYEGFDAVDFDGLVARHLLITVNSNHGGDCAGLAEVLIDVDGVITSVDELTENSCFDVQVYPNPHQGSFKANITTQCGQSLTATLYDAMGRQIVNRQLDQVHTENTIDFDQLGLAPGVYYLNVIQADQMQQYQVVRMR